MELYSAQVVAWVVARLSGAGDSLLTGILTIAHRAILIGLVTLIFVVTSSGLLVLSALIFTGWWQEFFLELGVGLLVAGIVDIAILGALHSLIEDTEKFRKGEDKIKEVLKRTFGSAAESQTKRPSRKPCGTGWPG
jgi:hypothetical protein